MKTYWYNCPRGFGNEYEIGVATKKAAREWYKLNGYERISRQEALKAIAWNGNEATQAYNKVSVDCDDYNGDVVFDILNGTL